VISSRRKELARKHHPDRGGSLTKMQAINAAADFLIDDLSRQGAPSPA
jgi:curved DNA-binding protein CbpA